MALQRAAGNRAVSGLIAASRASGPRRSLQRAIIAIDGASDSADAKTATRNALANLRGAKPDRHPTRPGPASWNARQSRARGNMIGPLTVGEIRIPAGFLYGPDETLYLLGHGSGLTVADLTPAQLAAQLRSWFAGVPFIGKIKLVSCVSAASQLPGSGARITPYAERLAAALRATGPADQFRPSSVQGIVGVGWVHESTGAQQSIDVAHYFAKIASPAVPAPVAGAPMIFPPLQSDPGAFFEEHQGLRERRVQSLFTPGTSIFEGKGPQGKLRWDVVHS